LAWKNIKSTANLLALRTLQLRRKDENYKEVRLRLRRKREEGKKHFDATYILYLRPIDVGKMVLLHNIIRRSDMSREQKMHFR
jgi:hypothetical protein